MRVILPSIPKSGNEKLGPESEKLGEEDFDGGGGDSESSGMKN